MGPIVAAVWLDQIASAGSELGRDLCALLLDREVQRQEFAGWRLKLKEIVSELSKGTFYDGWLDKWSPSEMVELCQRSPMRTFKFRVAQLDVFRKLYSISWR